MSEHDAFIAAICTSPDDDLPRLVYADWLDESGDRDRAEFIRLQVEYARTRHPHQNGRAAKLLRKYRDSWLPQVFFRDGLRAYWRRGFVWKVEVPTDLWLRHHAGGWTFSAAAVGSAPITRVTLRDRWPYSYYARQQWHHFSGTPDSMGHHYVLPATLFDLLREVKPIPYDADDDDVLAPVFDYRNRHHAVTALSEACVLHGRKRLGQFTAGRHKWDEHGPRYPLSTTPRR